MTVQSRYWAFLSYSHDDEASAKWLHRTLETYAIPRRLAGRASTAGPIPRRLHPIFRDRAELAADASLRARLQEALAQSAFLIVICSPAAARSRWVDEEIQRFKTLNGEARVLALIIGGQPQASLVAGKEDQECFPPALRTRLSGDADEAAGRVELIAADLRQGRDGRRLALLKLVARMLDVRLDDLIRRDAQRRQRQLVFLTGSSMAIALTMGVLALAALNAAREARQQRNQAEGLVEFMLGDLRKNLEPLGHLDLLDSVGARAMAYFTSEPNQRPRRQVPGVAGPDPASARRYPGETRQPGARPDGVQAGVRHDRRTAGAPTGGPGPDLQSCPERILCRQPGAGEGRNGAGARLFQTIQ